MSRIQPMPQLLPGAGYPINLFAQVKQTFSVYVEEVHAHILDAGPLQWVALEARG
jgi:hypothetical protein